MSGNIQSFFFNRRSSLNFKRTASKNEKIKTEIATLLLSSSTSSYFYNKMLI
jgi:hypothetical protein